MVLVTLACEDQIVLATDTLPLVEESEYLDNCESLHREESEIELDEKLRRNSDSKNWTIKFLRTSIMHLLLPFQVIKSIFDVKTLPVNNYIEVI